MFTFGPFKPLIVEISSSHEGPPLKNLLPTGLGFGFVQRQLAAVGAAGLIGRRAGSDFGADGGDWFARSVCRMRQL
jgi:hypothetical protein